jgi:hypothetical protein
MTRSQSQRSISRRTALAGLGAGGLGLALAATARPAAAQDSTPDEVANHPMVGAWLVAGPRGPSMTIVHPNGTWMDAGLAAAPGPNGTTFNSTTIGTWEPYGERGIHFTAVLSQTDAAGVFVGSLTIDGHPTASEDGLTFSDNDPETTLTIRDAKHNVVQVIADWKDDPTLPPRTGVRMGVGAPGFPEGTPTMATPAS